MPEVDVLVVGAGPAGCATAIRSHQLGRRVALLHRGGHPRAGWVEALPPATRRLLVALGLWEAFDAVGPTRNPGTVSRWGTSVAVATDAVRDPDGPGWNVVRGRFDDVLGEAVAAAGVRVLRGRLVAVRRRDGGMEVTDHTGATITATTVVDATGRASAVGQRLGARRQYRDHTVAHLRAEAAGRDRRTNLAGGPSGWSYSIAADDQQTSAWVSDPDVPPPPAWSGAGVRRVLANSAALDPLSGDGWVAAGDAALSFDPLSGQGVLTALHSGLRAAEAVASGDVSAYVERLGRVEAGYRQQLRDAYAAEVRFTGEPFWDRRRPARS